MIRSISLVFLTGLLFVFPVPAQNVQQLTAPTPTFGNQFGGSMDLSGERALVGSLIGSPGVQVDVFEQHDGIWMQVAALTGDSNPTNADTPITGFGFAVSLDGDRALVGAPSDSEIAYRQGAAYVFERQGDGVWMRVAKIIPDDAAVDDQFGCAVALNGERTLVGACQSVDKPGAAYIFEQSSDGLWTQVAKLTASDARNGESFGGTVALEGNRALVGSPLRAHVAPRQPIAPYVFEQLSDESWTQVARFSAEIVLEEITLQLDGDRAIVSGFLEGISDEHPWTAAAAIYERQQDGSWPEMARLISTDIATRTSFGSSVALRGNRAAFGAQEPAGETIRGAVYVFDRLPDGAWTQTHKLSHPEDATLTSFGSAVALEGNVILAGAPLENTNSQLFAGAAYAFSGVTFTPVEEETSPTTFTLSQNYPNPFSLATTLSFMLDTPVSVRLAVYDVLGREVAVLVDERLPVGSYTADFHATGLPSGVYFYRLYTDYAMRSRLMILRK